MALLSKSRKITVIHIREHNMCATQGWKALGKFNSTPFCFSREIKVIQYIHSNDLLGLGREIQYLQVLPGALLGFPVQVWDGGSQTHQGGARHWSHLTRFQWGAGAFPLSQSLWGLLEYRETQHLTAVKPNFAWELQALQTDMLKSLIDQEAKHAKLPQLINKCLEADTCIHTNFKLGKTVSFKLHNDLRNGAVSCLHKHFGRQHWAF